MARTGDDPARARTLVCVLALAVFALTALAFLPAFGAGWVRWDDPENFLGHDAWRGLGREQAAWAFTTFHMGPYQPLAWLTLGLDFELWGLEPRGYHATSVLFHALAAVAVFAAARELFRAALRPRESERASERDIALAAALAALLFGVHPLRAESVAWITERRDVLCGLFFALAIRAWLVRARSTGRAARRAYLASLAFALLALCSKASAMVLPAVLVVIDAWPLRRFERDRRAAIADKLPFGALALVFAALAWHGQAQLPGALKTLAQHDLVERAVQACYALGFYVWKSALPAGLSPMYDLPLDFPRARDVVVAGFGLVLGVACFASRRRTPAAWWTWLAYAAALAPTSGLAQAGSQLAADRYSYLATLPLAALAAGAWLTWLVRIPAQRTYALQIACGTVLVLGAACMRQTAVWRDTESLWNRALAVDPESASALQNLGALRLREAASATDTNVRRAALDEAYSLLERGFERAPSPEVRVNLGVADVVASELVPARASELLTRGIARIEDGIALGDAARRTQPNWHFQLALAYSKAGRARDALALLEPLARAAPADPDIAKLLASVRDALAREPR